MSPETLETFIVAFHYLNKRFSSTPVLSQPDLSKHFIVEVDQSDSDMGAVLFTSEETMRKKAHGCIWPSICCEKCGVGSLLLL